MATEFECLSENDAAVKLGASVDSPPRLELATKKYCIDCGADSTPLLPYADYECPPDKDIQLLSEDLTLNLKINFRDFRADLYSYITFECIGLLHVTETNKDYDIHINFDSSDPSSNPGIVNGEVVTETKYISVAVGSSDLYGLSGRLTIYMINFNCQTGDPLTSARKLYIRGYEGLIAEYSDFQFNNDSRMLEVNIPSNYMPELSIEIEGF